MMRVVDCASIGHNTLDTVHGTDKPKHKKKDAKGDSKKTNEISPGCIVEVKLSRLLTLRACAITRLRRVL